MHVRLKAREDRLELAVDDDGGARRELPGGGRGIDSMAHRVRACGGTFRAVRGPVAAGRSRPSCLFRRSDPHRTDDDGDQAADG